MNSQVTSQSLLMSDKFINVNCNDPTIQAAVDQKIINVQNNNPSFFTTKQKKFALILVSIFKLR